MPERRAMNARASTYGGARTAVATTAITPRVSSHLSRRRTTAMVHCSAEQKPDGRQKAQGKRQNANEGHDDDRPSQKGFAFCLLPSAFRPRMPMSGRQLVIAIDGPSGA